MAGRLAVEIRQKKPFDLAEVEAFLNLVRTAEVLSRRIAELLKPYRVSPTQYNVLRILRGAGAGGLTCTEVAERMVTHDPDITRLVDRLAARGLVERARSKHDRRLVIARITPEGLALLSSVDRPLVKFHQKHLGRLGKCKLAELIELLEELRAGCA